MEVLKITTAMEQMKERIRQLAKMNQQAKTKADKDKIKAEMESLRNKYPKSYVEALESLIKSTSKEYDELTMADRMDEKR